MIEYANLKDKIEDKEIVDDDKREEMKELQKSMGVDSIIFAKLFLMCYDYFYNNLSLFDDKKLESLVRSFDVVRLRELLEDYGGGTGFGAGDAKEKIKLLIKREDMTELILLWFQVFGEEE